MTSETTAVDRNAPIGIALALLGLPFFVLTLIFGSFTLWVLGVISTLASILLFVYSVRQDDQ